MNAEVSLSHMSGTKYLQGPPWQPVHFFPLLSTLGLLLLGLVVVSYETELIDRPLEAASDLLWRKRLGRLGPRPKHRALIVVTRRHKMLNQTPHHTDWTNTLPAPRGRLGGR